MSNLKSGSWCRPRDKKEWKAILQIAEGLGLCDNLTDRVLDTFYYDCDRIWLIESCRKAWPMYKEVDNGTYNKNLPEVSVMDFVTGLYQLAEDREPKQSTCNLLAKEQPGYYEFAPRQYVWVGDKWIDSLKPLEDRLSKLEARVLENSDRAYRELVGVSARVKTVEILTDGVSMPLSQVCQRLENMEAALSEHMAGEKLRCDRTDESMIEEIMEHFDFARPQRAMYSLNWGWRGGNTPSQPQMKNEARRLLEDLGKDRSLISTATGGFHAKRDRAGYLSLSFEVNGWNTNPH